MAYGNLALTQGERMLIVRRRSGKSQTAAARELGISRYRYSRMERDIEECPWTTFITEVEEHEKLLILRRRTGKTQKELGDEAGYSRYWVSQMERGKGKHEKLGEVLGET